MDKSSLSIFVTIRDRVRLVLEEEVEAITSNNSKGTFDILPQHANFITTIKDFVILHKKQNEKQHIKVERGILKVRENKVQIYLGI